MMKCWALVLSLAACGPPASADVQPPAPAPPPAPIPTVCDELKRAAAEDAAGCNLEILAGCDAAHETRQVGDCPKCDLLDAVNGALQRAGCVKGATHAS
jgi:hypothetical protein